jgi:hypothetical protein
MTFFQRIALVILPTVGLLAFALINFRHNRIYYGSPQLRLPKGLYNIEGLRCLVAGKEFNFNQAFDDKGLRFHTVKRDLMMYDDLVGRKLIVDDQFFTPTFGNASCMVSYSMRILENNFGRFTYSEVARYKIEPPGCSLSYMYRGKRYVDNKFIGESDLEIALERDRVVSHLIYKEKDIYLLYEEQVKDLTEYGCTDKDRFILMLSKQN